MLKCGAVSPETARCARCERVLRPDGKCPSCDERASGRVLGDATRGRIAQLERGWNLHSRTASPEPLPEDIEIDTDTPAPLPTPAPQHTPAPRPVSDAQVIEEVDARDLRTPTPTPLPARRADSASAPVPVAVSASAPIAIAAPGPSTLPSVPELSPVSAPPAPRGGFLGDVGYAFAVMFGALRGRRELASVRQRLEFERAERSRRLVDVARAALADPKVRSESLDAARDSLPLLDNERGRHIAAVEEADRDAARSAEGQTELARDTARRVAELEAGIGRLDGELRPVEADAARRKKALEDVRATLADSAKRIAAVEKRLEAARDADLRASLQAELAVARAERQALLRDEPTAVNAVAELEPRVAELRGQQEELRAGIAAARAEAARKDEALVAAARDARARQAEAQRARVSIEAARDAELLALGQALDRERPPALAPRFRPADEHAAAIAIIERRMVEIADASAAVDRRSLYRGLAMIAGVIVLVGVVLGFALR